MSRQRQIVLKCFLLLVVTVIVGFVYFAATYNLKDKAFLEIKNRTQQTWGNVINAFSQSQHGLKNILSNNKDVKTEFSDVIKNSYLQKISELERISQIYPNQNTTIKKVIPAVITDDKTAYPDVKSTKSSIFSASYLTSFKSSVILPVNDFSLSTIPQMSVDAVNCAKLIQGDPDEQMKADAFQKQHPKVIIPDEEIYKRALDCPKFISDRRYVTKPVSSEEEHFRLAFSILLFKDVEQFERLLRAIYRPQNYYCIHVDTKSKKQVKDAVTAIVGCFSNVFMAPEQYEVHWGTFSVLQPELSCMKELLKYKKWRYFINLTGQEFPLKTNWEIVQILKIFNGANNLEGTVKRRNLDRTANKPPPPANIIITKGSVHIVAKRKFVRYIIYNETSLKFRDWVKDTYVPDEAYFSSLNFNPHLKVPGSYLGVPETDTEKNLFITRFKNWGNGPFNWPCAGQRVRMVCVFSFRDLPQLARRVELFANKFYLDYEPLALDCMEELHYNRTRADFLFGPDVNKAFYASLDFVRNHL